MIKYLFWTKWSFYIKSIIPKQITNRNWMLPWNSNTQPSLGSTGGGGSSSTRQDDFLPYDSYIHTGGQPILHYIWPPWGSMRVWQSIRSENNSGLFQKKLQWASYHSSRLEALSKSPRFRRMEWREGKKSSPKLDAHQHSYPSLWNKHYRIYQFCVFCRSLEPNS